MRGRSLRDRRTRVLVGLILAIAVVGDVAGCGDVGPQRLPVTGSITLDGVPLPSGSITFAPLDGPNAASAEVRDGRFRTDRASGATPGRYQVEIVAVQPTGRRIPHPDLPTQTTEEVRNIVPSRYNVQTELKAEVKSDVENDFTFELSSRATTTKTNRR